MSAATDPGASSIPVGENGSASNSLHKRVGVIGAGISGAAASSHLASLGCHVSVFDLGRGPGGRMSQRWEKVEVGSPGSVEEVEVRFDHGAQYFSATNQQVASFLEQYRVQGVVAQWEGVFGTWIAESKTFEAAPDKERLVCVPGMNTLCQLALNHPRINAVYSTHVAGIEWDADQKQWSVKSNSGEDLGKFDAVVISAAYRTFRVDVRVLGSALTPQLEKLSSGITDVPASPCFALMLTFPQHQPSIPFDGAKISGCPTVSWAARNSTKPERRKVGESQQASKVENWVVHSTPEYAKAVMAAAPAGRPSPELLSKVSQEMLTAFKALFPGEVVLPEPILAKVHRWGGAFPAEARAPEGEKFLSGGDIPVVACGDFCVSPRVDAAVDSALAAASAVASMLQIEQSKM